MQEFIKMLQLNRLTLKGKYIIINLVIIFSLFVNSKSTFSQKYEYIGKDSILIINPMMYYHLDLLKHKHNFEGITFKEYNTNSFKSIYDSLSSLYVPFKKYYAGQSLWDYKIGLNVAFDFLIDSNTSYSLWIFIPDSIYDSRSYFKSNLMKKLFSLRKFGIVAFKDSSHFKALNEIYKENKQDMKENEFYIEYKELLKKLNKKRKMKIENGK